MKLRFIGTAASEGIPAMFCRCRICENARNVKGKEIKTRSCYMINDDLMIDFSADTNSNAFKYGLDLSALKYLLVTHTHCDHFYFEDLFQRNKYSSMNRTVDVLSIYGNSVVNDIYSKYPHESEVYDNLKCNAVHAFDEYCLGDYTVIPIKSIHMSTEESLVYIIKQGGKTYFHCLDTGLLPKESYDYIEKSGIVFDAVTFDFTFGLIKEGYYGHHNLDRLLNVIDSLKNMGAITDQTKMLASHVSHYSGSTHEDLQAVLQKYNVQLAYDGLEIEI